MVEADGFVELSAEVIDECEGKEGLRVGGVEADALFKEGDCAFVVFEFAAGVS